MPWWGVTLIAVGAAVLGGWVAVHWLGRQMYRNM
jgi:hypothetical protein